MSRSRRVLLAAATLVISAAAHITLFAPRSAALPCVWVEYSPPPVWVSYCPPV